MARENETKQSKQREMEFFPDYLQQFTLTNETNLWFQQQQQQKHQ